MKYIRSFQKATFFRMVGELSLKELFQGDQNSKISV